MSKSNSLLGTNIPFVEAAHRGGRQRPTAIVVKTSFTTGDTGAALGIALAWHHSYNRVDSCHYVIDGSRVIRCIPDQFESMSSDTVLVPNKRAITINVCHEPWDDPIGDVVDLTAKQVARLCRLHRIRPKLLDAKGLDRWVKHPWRRRGGIIVTTFPSFPETEFFESVQEYRKNY